MNQQTVQWAETSLNTYWNYTYRKLCKSIKQKLFYSWCWYCTKCPSIGEWQGIHKMEYYVPAMRNAGKKIPFSDMESSLWTVFYLVIYGIELHVKYSLFWVIRKDNMYLYLHTSKTKLLTDMQEPNNCNKEGADMEIFSLSMFLLFSWIFEAFKCVIYSKKKCKLHGMFIWMALLLQLSPFPICLLTHSTFCDLGFHVPLARVQFYLSCLKEGRWSQIEANYSHLLFLGILRSN